MTREGQATHQGSGISGDPWRSMVAAGVVVLLTCSAAACSEEHELQLSLEHYQAGRYQEAITAAKTALVANPNSAGAYNNLAVSYLALSMYDEAIHAAQEASSASTGRSLNVSGTPPDVLAALAPPGRE